MCACKQRTFSCFTANLRCRQRLRHARAQQVLRQALHLHMRTNATSVTRMLFHTRRSAGGHQQLATILKHPAKAVQVSQSGRPDKQVSEALRLLPVVAGGTGFLALLVNRVTSGVAPVVDASSSQSRVDVLVIALQPRSP